MLDEDGEANPIISWSDLHVLYQLPDGSKWAEHGNFYDCEDLVSGSAYNGKLHMLAAHHTSAECLDYLHAAVARHLTNFCCFQGKGALSSSWCDINL